MKTISADEFKKRYGTDAVSQFAAPVTAPKEIGFVQKNVVNPIKNAFMGGVDQTKQSFNDIVNDVKTTNAPKSIADTLHLGAGIAGIISSPLAPIVDPTIGAATNAIANVAGDVPAIRKFANSNVGKAVNTGVQVVNDANTIVGTGLMAEGGIKGFSKNKGALIRENSSVSNTPVRETGPSALSRKLYETGIGRNTAEAERTLNYRAAIANGENATAPTTRATVAQKYGLAGRQSDIGVQAKTTGTKLFKDHILPELQKSKEIITKDDLFKSIQEKIDATVDPSRKAELQDAFDALQEDYKNESQWSLEKAQELKSGIDKFTPDKVFKGKPIANAFNELRHDMADNIRTYIYDKLSNVGIKQKYLDYGNLKELQKIGVEGLANNRLKGGAGSFISGLIEKAATPIATTAGKILYKIDNTPITFTADKGIKTFGDFLKSQGYNPNNFKKGTLK